MTALPCVQLCCGLFTVLPTADDVEVVNALVVEIADWAEVEDVAWSKIIIKYSGRYSRKKANIADYFKQVMCEEKPWYLELYYKS